MPFPKSTEIFAQMDGILGYIEISLFMLIQNTLQSDLDIDKI